MFSLIITVVGIALVVALVAATIYYGGDAFNKSSAKAAATRVVTGGQQISAAVEAYKVTVGDVPPSLDALVTSNFLSVIPAGTWVMGNDYVAASGLTVDQCTEANKQLGLSTTPTCAQAAASGITACCSN